MFASTQFLDSGHSLNVLMPHGRTMVLSIEDDHASSFLKTVTIYRFSFPNQGLCRQL